MLCLSVGYSSFGALFSNNLLVFIITLIIFNINMNGDDIYGDLDDFDIGDTISKFEENKKALTQLVEESQKRIDSLSDEVSVLNKVNKDLKVNISELYKTAKAEIERKSRQLADLRREVDDTLFRRGIKKKITEVDNDLPDKEDGLLKQLQEARNTLVQKNRIIASLNKELQNVKVQIMEKNDSKRNISLIDDENDDTIHKRPKNSHFENGQTNYRNSNYKSKGYDDRRNRSDSKSPDRRKKYYRNSDFKLDKDKRFNKFKDNRSRSNEGGRYVSRNQTKDKHSNDRFKYKQQGYDSSRPEHMKRHLGKGQNDRISYCSYNTSEFSNRSESSYNSRSSLDDRRHTSPSWCEKSDAQKHNDNTCNNKLQIDKITQRRKLKPTLVKTFKEELEEGELDSTVADSNEDSINPDNIKVNNLVAVNNTREILKEDIRNIVTVEDILQEPDNSISVVRPETCKTEDISVNTDNAVICAQVTCNTVKTPPSSTSNEPGETNTSVKPEANPSVEPVTTEQVARNETQPPIVRRKITAKRRRCVVTIT